MTSYFSLFLAKVSKILMRSFGREKVEACWGSRTENSTVSENLAVGLRWNGESYFRWKHGMSLPKRSIHRILMQLVLSSPRCDKLYTTVENCKIRLKIFRKYWKRQRIRIPVSRAKNRSEVRIDLILFKWLHHRALNQSGKETTDLKIGIGRENCTKSQRMHCN